MANIGYARCSTLAQDLTAQRQALAALGVPADRVYLDKGLTGTSRARPGLDQALAAVREGDTLTVTKLDRLARSVPDALDILGQLSARGVRFALGGSVYDWNDPFARMFLQILAVIAEFEANLIRQRTREGMDIARQNGKLRGKQPASSPPRTARSAACTTAATTTLPGSPPCSASAGPPCTGPSNGPPRQCRPCPLLLQTIEETSRCSGCSRRPCVLEGDDENDIVRFLVAVDDQHPSPRPEDDPHRRPASL